jgi:putative pyruvate formate lyase activating enzyme
VIGPDGSVHISFLWDDLRELAGLGPAVGFEPTAWTAPPGVALASPDYDECALCPKACGFDRFLARHPRCGDALLRVSNVGITLGDEPAIRGTRGSGAIMLAGCPLKCPSCHNPEKVADGVPTDATGFFGICEGLLRDGAHNIQILSPTVHFPALRTLLGELRRSGFPLPVVLKSSGYESISELRKLEGLVDVYLPDLKFGGCSSWAVRAGVRNYFSVAREAISEMIRQVGDLHLAPDGTAVRGVLVRHVEAPLPEAEKQEISAYLDSLRGQAAISRQAHFVSLEG